MEKTIATSSLKTGFNLTNLLLVSAFAPWKSLHSPKPSSASFQSQTIFFPASEPEVMRLVLFGC